MGPDNEHDTDKYPISDSESAPTTPGSCPSPTSAASWRKPYPTTPKSPRTPNKQCRNACRSSSHSSRARLARSVRTRSGRPSTGRTCSGPSIRWALRGISIYSSSIWVSIGIPLREMRSRRERARTRIIRAMIRWTLRIVRMMEREKLRIRRDCDDCVWY